MAVAVSVLCARVRVEEKGIIAALAEAGVPAAPLAPAELALPFSPSPEPQAPPSAGAPGAAAPPAPGLSWAADAAPPLVLDRCADRAVAAAVLPVWRALGVPTLDAGLAATGTRATVAGALAAAGLPRPITRLVSGEASALAAAAAMGYPATLLPLTPGARSVTLWDEDTAEAVLEHRAVLGDAADALALLQAGAPAPAARALVTVVDGEPVALAGEGAEAALADGRPAEVAAAAAIALGASVATVEVALAPGGPVVWDVLPVADFRAAVSLTGRSVADAIAALACERLAMPTVFSVAMGVEFGAAPDRRWLPGGQREVIGGVAIPA